MTRLAGFVLGGDLVERKKFTSERVKGRGLTASRPTRRLETTGRLLGR